MNRTGVAATLKPLELVTDWLLVMTQPSGKVAVTVYVPLAETVMVGWSLVDHEYRRGAVAQRGEIDRAAAEIRLRAGGLDDHLVFGDGERIGGALERSA